MSPDRLPVRAFLVPCQGAYDNIKSGQLYFRERQEAC